MRNCWSVLGISPTADKKEIKKAYAAKSREFHPAEHPAEYEELKKAYQEAIRLSSQPQPQPEPEQRPVLNPIPEKDQGLEEFYDHLETEARSKFVPNAGQWNLDFHFASTQVLGETEQEQQQVFASIRSNQNLNWCQRSHIDLFLRQAFLFHQYNTFRADHWEALCEEVKERYRKEVGQYPDSKHSVFFPDPNVTEHLIGVLSQMPELDYRTWDVFEKYMLPPQSKRNKAEWAPVVDRFLAVREFRQPGHSYPDYRRQSVSSLRKELFSWEPQQLEKKSNTRVGLRIIIATWTVILVLMGVTSAFGSHSNRRPQQNDEIINETIAQYNQEQMEQMREKYKIPQPIQTGETPELMMEHHFIYNNNVYFIKKDGDEYYVVRGTGEAEPGELEECPVDLFIANHPDSEEQVNAGLATFKEEEVTESFPTSGERTMDDIRNEINGD